jgi:hypothetical protein
LPTRSTSIAVFISQLRGCDILCAETKTSRLTVPIHKSPGGEVSGFKHPQIGHYDLITLASFEALCSGVGSIESRTICVERPTRWKWCGEGYGVQPGESFNNYLQWACVYEKRAVPAAAYNSSH